MAINAPSATLDQARIAVLGLGYVGLPLAVAFGKYFPTLEFDIDAARVTALTRHLDHTLEICDDALRAASLLEFSIERGAEGIRAFGVPGAALFDVKRALPGASVDGCL